MLAAKASLKQGNEEHIINIWNLESGELIRTIKSDSVTMIFSNDEKVLVVGSKNGLCLYNVENGELIRKIVNSFTFQV